MFSRLKPRQCRLHQTHLCVKLLKYYLMGSSSPWPLGCSSTNALLQALVGPECGRAASVHFLGSSGRFLATARERVLILWDLGFQSSVYSLTPTSTFSSCDREVLWRFRSGTLIDIGQVVAHRHPSGDKLALLQPCRNTNSSHRETRTPLPRPSPATPPRTCSTPSGI